MGTFGHGNAVVRMRHQLVGLAARRGAGGGLLTTATNAATLFSPPAAAAAAPRIRCGGFGSTKRFVLSTFVPKKCFFVRRRHTTTTNTTGVHETLVGRAMGHALEQEELFAFDLNGFIVVKNVFTEEEIEAMNAAVDAHEREMVERKGQLRLGGKKGAPLAGDGDTGRQDLGGMLAWPGEEKMLFRKMLAHPKLVPYYIALCGEGYRMDHLPLLIQQKKGADGFDFHGGRLNQDGSWIQGLAYEFVNGRPYCHLLAASIALTTTRTGEGGYAVLPGSHKSNVPVPPDVMKMLKQTESVRNPEIERGDVLLFTEACTHGTIPWSGEGRDGKRRAVLYRFAPANMAYGRSYMPEWPKGTTDGMTDAEKAVLQPPFNPRLDRTLVCDDGTQTTTFARAEFKKAHDAKVFNNPEGYF